MTLSMSLELPDGRYRQIVVDDTTMDLQTEVELYDQDDDGDDMSPVKIDLAKLPDLYKALQALEVAVEKLKG